jgi:hypothetical protein
MDLNENQRQELEAATGQGMEVTFEYPETGVEGKGTVVDEVYNITRHYKNLIQQIKLHQPHEDGSKFIYRFAYYVYSQKSNSVVWAQRPLVVSSTECQDLLEKARAKKWDAFPD